MLWVWCTVVVLSGRKCSPHRLERETAESSGWTRGVNSTEWPSSGAVEVEGLGEPLTAAVDVAVLDPVLL